MPQGHRKPRRHRQASWPFGTSIAQTVAGASTAGTGGGVSIRGARTSTWYYIDGIKVRGSSALPKSAIEEVQVVTGGIPANIGDATGGVINISLRNASRKWFGGGEMITPGLPIGESVVGLDKFGYNLAEMSASGPIVGERTQRVTAPTLAGLVPFRQLHLPSRHASHLRWPLPNDRRCTRFAACKPPSPKHQPSGMSTAPCTTQTS